MQPLSTHIVVCRFAGTDSGQRAMATLPVDSDFVEAAAYPALFGLLGTSIEKIETNEMRNDFTRPYNAKPLMVMVMVAAVMVVEDARQE